MSQPQPISLHPHHQINQPHPAIAPISLNSRQQARRRGIVLTQQGWQKLHQANVLCNEFGERYTYEYLSEQTLLDPRTVCRLVGREVAVDKRSLNIFFNAFNLELHQEDYTTPRQARREPQASLLSNEAELTHLKQQIIESCHCFIQFLKLDSNSNVTLSVKLLRRFHLK